MKDVWEKKIIKLVPGHIKKDHPELSEKQIEERYSLQLTVSEHYFAKNGVYLDKKEN